MKKRNTLLFSIFFIMSQTCAQQRVVFKPETTKIHVSVKNSNTQRVVVQTTPIGLQLIPSKPNQENVTLDTNGYGETDILLTGPAMIKIMNIWIDSSVDYLVMPGRDFSVELDFKNRKFARYREDWMRENDFYQFMIKDAQRRLEEISQNDPIRFMHDWQMQNNYSLSLIDIANKQGMNTQFTSWVLQSVHSLFYGTLIRQLVNNVIIKGKWPENMPAYMKELNSLNSSQFDNATYFTSETDKEWAMQYFLFDAVLHFFQKDSSLVPGSEKIFRYAISRAKTISDPGVKRWMIQYLAKTATEGTSDIKFLNWVQNALKGQTEYQYYESIIHDRISLLQIASDGKPALFFKAEDKDGNSFSWDNYKGQYVYVDIWATWCIPCRREMPYLERIKEKYSKKPIVFLSVSEDKSRNAWIEYLKTIPNSSTHFISNPDIKESISRTYRVKYIPAFILVGPNGKLISVNCYRPSDPALDMLLEKLLY